MENTKSEGTGEQPIKHCRECGVELIPEENWAPSYVKKRDRICRGCVSKRSRKYREENREAILEKKRKRYEENREEVLEHHWAPENRLRGIVRDMLRRCYDEDHTGYKHYGGCGVGVSWFADHPDLPRHELVDLICAAIVDEIGLPEPHQSLDRIANGKSWYRPGNLRWLHCEGQCRNRRSTKISLDKIPTVIRRRDQGETFTEIATTFHCHQSAVLKTYHNYKPGGPRHHILIEDGLWP